MMSNVNNIKSSEFRKEAWNNLSDGGKWKKAALSTLIFILFDIVVSSCLKILFLVAGIVPLVIMSVIVFLAIPALNYGFLVEMIKLKNGEEYSYFDFLKFGFEKFSMVWKVCIRVVLEIIVPYLLFTLALFISIILSIMFGSIVTYCIAIIGGIIATIATIQRILKYMLCNIEIYNNPSCKHSKEIVENLGSRMMGYRSKLFVLMLTFLGWSLLCIFSIPMLWIFPYIEITKVVFYERLLVDGKESENLE